MMRATFFLLLLACIQVLPSRASLLRNSIGDKKHHGTTPENLLNPDGSGGDKAAADDERALFFARNLQSTSSLETSSTPTVAKDATVVFTPAPAISTQMPSTSFPTFGPSFGPSFEPTTQPTLPPSLAPPLVPPSVMPTSIFPSDAPSIFVPSQVPSDLPSDLPSLLPSDEPSSLPSLLPSMMATSNNTAANDDPLVIVVP